MGLIAVGERNKMLDALAGRTTYTANAAVWVKLHTGDPGAAGTNNAAGETTRKQVTFGSAASAGAIPSTAQVQWTGMSTAETITWVSFWTASTGGTFLANDDLPAAKTVGVGDSLTIASGDISLTVT